MHSSLIPQNYSVSDLIDALNRPLQGRVDAVKTKRKVSPHSIFCCRNFLFLACSTSWRHWIVFESSYFCIFTSDQKGSDVSDFSHAGGTALWMGLNTLSVYVSAILAHAGIPEAWWWNVPLWAISQLTFMAFWKHRQLLEGFSWDISQIFLLPKMICLHLCQINKGVNSYYPVSKHRTSYLVHRP